MPARRVVKPGGNRVQGLVPADPLELVFPPGARPFQREQETVGGVHDVCRAAHTGAAHCVRAALGAVTVPRDISARHDPADPPALYRDLNSAPGRAKSAVPLYHPCVLRHDIPFVLFYHRSGLCVRLACIRKVFMATIIAAKEAFPWNGRYFQDY